MDEAAGARSRGMSRILCEGLVRRLDQYFDVLRFEYKIPIELSAREIIETLDRRTAHVASRDADRVQEWQFQHAVLCEEGCAFIAVGDDGEKL